VVWTPNNPGLLGSAHPCFSGMLARDVQRLRHFAIHRGCCDIPKLCATPAWNRERTHSRRDAHRGLLLQENPQPRAQKRLRGVHTTSTCDAERLCAELIINLRLTSSPGGVDQTPPSDVGCDSGPYLSPSLIEVQPEVISTYGHLYNVEKISSSKSI